MTRRRIRAVPLPSLFFPHLGGPRSWSRQVLRQNQGLQRLGGTGRMTQSQPLPFPETRPFPLATSSQALFSQTPNLATGEGDQGQVAPQGAGRQMTDSKVVTVPQSQQGQGCLDTDRLGHGVYRNSCS